MKHKESNLASNVAKFMQVQFPTAIYQYTIGADVRLPINTARRLHKLNGRWSKGFVDIFIYEARNGYHGLAIELKAVTPFKKNGELKKDSHLENQANFHKELEARGYKAIFTTGFEETVEAIREYLSP